MTSKSSKKRKQYRKGYYQKKKKWWKEKYADDSKRLDERKEYYRQYYQKNKNKLDTCWKNKDGTWKTTKTKESERKRYYRRKKIKRRPNEQQKRLKRSLERGSSIERAIQIAYPECKTKERVSDKLCKLRKNDYLAITIDDYLKLHSDAGLTPFKSAVKRDMIVEKVDEKSDPKTDGNAIRVMEWMDRLGKKVGEKEQAQVNIGIFVHTEEKRTDMERILEKERERREKAKKIEEKGSPSSSGTEGN